MQKAYENMASSYVDFNLGIRTNFRGNVLVSIKLHFFQNTRVLTFLWMRSELFFCLYFAVTDRQSVVPLPFKHTFLSCANCRDKAELPAICDLLSRYMKN